MELIYKYFHKLVIKNHQNVTKSSCTTLNFKEVYFFQLVNENKVSLHILQAFICCFSQTLEDNKKVKSI